MAMAFRRVVTEDDELGRSRVMMDDAPEHRGIAADFWRSGPALPGNSGADPVPAGGRLEPPTGGSVFRFFVVPPEDRVRHKSDVERELLYAAHFQSMGAAHARVDTRRHPGMHRTNTVDYIVLLSGSVTLLLDDGAVELKPFDVVVQRGTNHAWVNYGSTNALLAAVLLDAGGNTSFGG
jgi:quercetin dioxygenase-like cupin family protein